MQPQHTALRSLMKTTIAQYIFCFYLPNDLIILVSVTMKKKRVYFDFVKEKSRSREEFREEAPLR